MLVVAIVGHCDKSRISDIISAIRGSYIEEPAFIDKDLYSCIQPIDIVKTVDKPVRYSKKDTYRGRVRLCEGFAKSRFRRCRT